MSEKFYTILTNIGKSKIANFAINGEKVKFIKLKVGDGNGKYYNPIENQKDLINTVWEGKIGNIQIDKDNPNWIVLETIIPPEVGDFTIREYGAFDEEDNLLAISKCPETYKPTISNGSTKELIIKMILSVSNTESISFEVDPNIMLAKNSKVDEIDKKVNYTISQLKDCAKQSDLDITNNNLAQLSNPNLLINGDFQVWQRGTSFDTPTSHNYTADRWRVGLAKGSYTLRRDNNTLRIEPKATDWHCNIEQVLDEEDNLLLQGQSVTFSVNINFPNPENISICIEDDSEVFGNVICKKGRNTVTCKLTNSRFLKNLKVAIKFITIEKTISTLFISNAKLEIGSIVTPFVPRSYGEELALCQRYYEVIPRLADMADPNIDVIRTIGYYKVTKRVDPTITYFWNNEVNKIGCVRTSDNQTIGVTPTAFYKGGIENIIVDGALGFVGYLQWETRIVADAEIY